MCSRLLQRSARGITLPLTRRLRRLNRAIAAPRRALTVPSSWCDDLASRRSLGLFRARRRARAGRGSRRFYIWMNTPQGSSIEHTDGRAPDREMLSRLLPRRHPSSLRRAELERNAATPLRRVRLAPWSERSTSSSDGGGAAPKIEALPGARATREPAGSAAARRSRSRSAAELRDAEDGGPAQAADRGGESALLNVATTRRTRRRSSSRSTAGAPISACGRGYRRALETLLARARSQLRARGSSTKCCCSEARDRAIQPTCATSMFGRRRRAADPLANLAVLRETADAPSLRASTMRR